MERLRINQGGYRGEGIDVSDFLKLLKETALRHRWQWEIMTISGAFEIPALKREQLQPRKRIYLSAGIHGDEAAGPLAILELLQEDAWPGDFSIYLCPCLNPTGLAQNTRENEQGMDQNRDYRDLKTPEVRAHVRWLSQQPPFDLNLCLHEDWEANGFYVYELNLDNRPSLAPVMVEKVSQICPIETAATIDTWTAEKGVILPSKERLERPDWPEALFLIQNKTRQGYTLEAPSDYPMKLRVKALVEGVHAVFDYFRQDQVA